MKIENEEMKIENVRMLALAALTAKADILTRHTDTDILTRHTDTTY